MEQIQLNEHNKQEYPPMHTCEHIVNRTMVNLFGCGRAVSAHIERKKSKLDFALPQAPSPDDIARIEQTVNEVASHYRIYHTRRSRRTLRFKTIARRSLGHRPNCTSRRLR